MIRKKKPSRKPNKKAAKKQRKEAPPRSRKKSGKRATNTSRFVWEEGNLQVIAGPDRKAATSADGDWSAFAKRLGRTLDAMEMDHFLILTIPDEHRFVQFSTQGAWGLRAECVSNQYLSVRERLTTDQEQALARLGWHRPDLKAVGSGSEGANRNGSTNWYRDFDRPVDYATVTSLAARTLEEVYGGSSSAVPSIQGISRERRHAAVTGIGNRPGTGRA